MKHLLFFATLAVLVVSNNAMCQEKPTDGEKARMAAAFQEMSKPGPEHKQLESLVGDWDEEGKISMGPGKPPMIVKGIRKNRMILGGRFLLGESKSAAGPTPLESMIIMGFDRRQKKYTAYGFDNGGTYAITASGEFDDSKKAIRLYSEDVDPVLHQTQKYYLVTRIISPNQYVTEFLIVDPEHTGTNKEVKVYEATFTRK
jgi:hypothetical protein